MGQRLLVIDDDKWIGVSLELLLENEGVEVLSADGGESGLIRAREDRPQIILLDLMMPGRGGWETLVELKKDPQTTSIPVIVFSGWEYRHARERARELGASAFLSKPFRTAELLGEIRAQLAGPELRAMAAAEAESSNES